MPDLLFNPPFQLKGSKEHNDCFTAIRYISERNNMDITQTYILNWSRLFSDFVGWG